MLLPAPAPPDPLSPASGSSPSSEAVLVEGLSFSLKRWMVIGISEEHLRYMQSVGSVGVEDAWAEIGVNVWICCVECCMCCMCMHVCTHVSGQGAAEA